MVWHGSVFPHSPRRCPIDLPPELLHERPPVLKQDRCLSCASKSQIIQEAERLVKLFRLAYGFPEMMPDGLYLADLVEQLARRLKHGRTEPTIVYLMEDPYDEYI